ncbi:MAG: hypothetical protein HY791_06210 [Deltaproteobacteria bacterium]|nr:hypothetical protein [Deltaproteobacteria bacterium]
MRVSWTDGCPLANAYEIEREIRVGPSPEDSYYETVALVRGHLGPFPSVEFLDPQASFAGSYRIRSCLDFDGHVTCSDFGRPVFPP